MSLNVYLRMPVPPSEHGPDEDEHIYIREGGRTQRISREEWDRRFPGREPVTMRRPPSIAEEPTTVFSAHITHNLRAMAHAADLYTPLWCPETVGITQARQLIPLLEQGLRRLRDTPDLYTIFNPSNGWGTYEALVGFVTEYLEACRQYPEATVHTWR